MGYKNGDCCVIRHRILAAILAVMLKKYNPEYSILISLGAGALLLWMILSKISPAISQIRELISAAGISGEYGVILLKTLGVCFLTQLSADSCRDAGEGALAAKVELAGKLFIVILALLYSSKLPAPLFP